jgi:hypothetical protein
MPLRGEAQAGSCTDTMKEELRMIGAVEADGHARAAHRPLTRRRPTGSRARRFSPRCRDLP